MLGVHEATASRRLTRLHGELRQRVAARLVSDHGWSPTEAERSLAEAATHLDHDLSSLLVAESAGQQRREELLE
ncbi:MAG: hypothetical protein M3Q76_11745 [Acidobacteriota bacterium]|nr:hypothetical protein [Acidobacteriota bacterium]